MQSAHSLVAATTGFSIVNPIISALHKIGNVPEPRKPQAKTVFNGRGTNSYHCQKDEMSH
jgi:hypothetical protein